MAKQDLTLREVEEAEKYDLNPDQWDALKAHFLKVFKEKYAADCRAEVKKELETELRPKIATEMRPSLREDVEKEMRPKLTTKIREELHPEVEKELEPKVTTALTPKIRIDVEKELGEKMRSDARAEVEAEQRTQAATPKDREAFRNFMRELELDCLANADAASDLADEAETRFKRMRWIRNPIFYGLLIGALPMAYYLYSSLGWTHTHFGLYAVMVPWIVAFLTIWGRGSTHDENLTKSRDAHRKTASDYWKLAEGAKGFRMVDADIVQTRSALFDTMRNHLGSKQRVDDQFFPSAKVLERSRHEVREQVIADMNTEQLLRVESTKEPAKAEEMEVAEDGPASEPRRAVR